MTDQTAPKNIDEALLILQQDPPVLLKDQDGQVGNQKTKYADLVQANEKILSRLTELGVLWKTKPTTIMIPGPNGQQDPRFVLEYRLLHVESGTHEDGIYPLPAGANPMQNGSAITYARRYALIAVTNTVAEGMDDDGRGYADRRGMAQRANVRDQQHAPAPTAQRADPPAPRPERARPEQQPSLPEPRQRSAPQNGDRSGSVFRGRGGLITEAMTTKLVIVMNEVIGNKAAEHRSFITELIGREIASRKDLTFDEGRALIDAFEKAKGDEDPASKAAEIYIRTTTGVGADPAPPSAKRTRKTARPPETRSVQEQTRDAVLGRPAQPGDEVPPWEYEQGPADAEGSGVSR